MPFTNSGSQAKNVTITANLEKIANGKMQGHTKKKNILTEAMAMV